MLGYSIGDPNQLPQLVKSVESNFDHVADLTDRQTRMNEKKGLAKYKLSPDVSLQSL